MSARPQRQWAPQMWVPIAVYALYAFAVLRPDFLDLSWLRPDGSRLLALAGTIDFMFQVLMVWTIPIALLIRALPLQPVRWVWWVLGPLIVLVILIFFLSWVFSGSGAATFRILTYGLNILAGLTYFGRCLRHADPKRAHRSPIALGVLVCVSL